MTDNEPGRDSSRRWRRWLLSGSVAAVSIAAVAIYFSGSQLGPGIPASTPSTTGVGTTEPLPDSATPSDGSTPTKPVLPEPSAGSTPTKPVIPNPSQTSQGTTSPATPRTQPTTNEDSAPRATKSPVNITAEATPRDGLEARLTRIESVEGEAVIPGEVGGPALRITLEVMNNTSEVFDTPAVVVNLYKGKALSPAGPLLTPGGMAFPASIAPGQSAQGVYLFTVDTGERDDITIEVDLAVGTPIVLFQGAVR